MKLILTLAAALSLTACGSMGPYSCGGQIRCEDYYLKRLNEKGFRYFPQESITITTFDECEEVVKRLNDKYPYEKHPDNNKSYWVNLKDQKAYYLSDTRCGYISQYWHGPKTLEVISLYELAMDHARKKDAKAAKVDHINKRVDKMGL